MSRCFPLASNSCPDSFLVWTKDRQASERREFSYQRDVYGLLVKLALAPLSLDVVDRERALLPFAARHSLEDLHTQLRRIPRTVMAQLAVGQDAPWWNLCPLWTLIAPMRGMQGTLLHLIPHVEDRLPRKGIKERRKKGKKVKERKQKKKEQNGKQENRENKKNKEQKEKKK